MLRNLGHGALGGNGTGRPSAPPAPLPAPRRRPEDEADAGGDEDDDDVLTLVLDKDFMQQLSDRFGHGSTLGERPEIVRVPVSFARQMHYFVLLTRQQDWEEEAEAKRRRCEEDERIARRLFEDMCHERARRDGPEERHQQQRAAAGQGQAPSPEAARAAARRQLEDKFPQIDREMIRFMLASHGDSAEAAAKELEGLLLRDEDFVGGAAGGAGGAAGGAGRGGGRPAGAEPPADSFLEALQVKDLSDDEDENPWEAVDSMAVFNKYRERAEQWRQRRDYFYRSASQAFRDDRRTQAGFYSEQGQECDKQFQRCSALASAALIAAHSDRSAETLDLHYFKVDEAVTVLDLFLDFHIRRLAERGVAGEAGEGGEERLLIVTGRGAHSSNGRPGRPRVKPAVLSRARQRQLRFAEFRDNPGVVRLFVTKDSLPSHQVPAWARPGGNNANAPWARAAFTGPDRTV